MYNCRTRVSTGYEVYEEILFFEKKILTRFSAKGDATIISEE